MGKARKIETVEGITHIRSHAPNDQRSEAKRPFGIRSERQNGGGMRKGPGHSGEAELLHLLGFDFEHQWRDQTCIRIFAQFGKILFHLLNEGIINSSELFQSGETDSDKRGWPLP